MATQDIWEEDFRVLTFHMDPKGKAHLSSICNFLQEGASMHAEYAGFGYDNMIKNDQVWVLARQKVIVKTYPIWNEKLKLKTWSRGKEGIFYIRDFIIENEKKDIIVKATSSWAAINIHTRRPELVPRLEQGLKSVHENVAIDEKLSKLPELENPEFVRKRQIEFTDIDLVYHVNNVKYIELIMNSFPLSTHKRKKVRMLEINYLGEAKYEDQVVINRTVTNSSADEYGVNIIREADNKEVCRAKLTWE